jgi:hypothetical protein
MVEVSPDSLLSGTLRVTGPLLSLVLRAEDVCQRYNQYIEVCGALNQGFPFSPLQCRQGRTWMDEGVVANKCVRRM